MEANQENNENIEEQSVAGSEEPKSDNRLVYTGAVLALVAVVILGYKVLTTKPEEKTVLDQSKAQVAETPVNEASGSAQTNTMDQAPTKLLIEDLKVGTGTAAKNWDKVVVNYVGTLPDGRKFDSSYDRNAAFTFTLGAGEVIAGWDQGVAGMKVGGKRKLTIPPELGYGPSSPGGIIPANATLIFEVELVKINK